MTFDPESPAALTPPQRGAVLAVVFAWPPCAAACLFIAAAGYPIVLLPMMAYFIAIVIGLRLLLRRSDRLEQARQIGNPEVLAPHGG